MKSFLKGLGLGFLCLVLFVVGVIFNTEFLGLKNNSHENMEFSRDIEVSNELMPDTYNSNLNFSASNELSQKSSINAEDKKTITASFEQISKRIAKEGFCKGGSYTLEPSYNYHQGQKLISGYRLYSDFYCQFPKDKIQNYNQLVKDIEEISALNPLILFNTKTLQTGFNDASLEENKEDLYDLVLKKAAQKAEYYSKNLAKTCIIKSINFDQCSIDSFRTNLAASADSAVLPILQNEKQSLKAKVVFICK